MHEILARRLGISIEDVMCLPADRDDVSILRSWS